MVFSKNLGMLGTSAWVAAWLTPETFPFLPTDRVVILESGLPYRFSDLSCFLTLAQLNSNITDRGQATPTR